MTSLSEVIEVQTLHDLIGEDEKLNTIQLIKRDYELFEFFFSFGHDHVTEMSGGRTWPSVCIDGYLSRMPSFYIYLIDIEIDDCQNRIVTVALTHWLLGIYAKLEITYRIYPEFFNDSDQWLYLPFVTYPQCGFKLEYCEEYTTYFTPRERSDFVCGKIDNVILFPNSYFNTYL
jgi:hypothetical protein